MCIYIYIAIAAIAIAIAIAIYIYIYVYTHTVVCFTCLSMCLHVREMTTSRINVSVDSSYIQRLLTYQILQLSWFDRPSFRAAHSFPSHLGMRSDPKP